MAIPVPPSVHEAHLGLTRTSSAINNLVESGFRTQERNSSRHALTIIWRSCGLYENLRIYIGCGSEVGSVVDVVGRIAFQYKKKKEDCDTKF